MTLLRWHMGGGLRKPFLKGVDILNALIVVHTKTDIQQLKVIIAGDAVQRWTEVQTMIELKPCPFCGAKMGGAE